MKWTWASITWDRPSTDDFERPADVFAAPPLLRVSVIRQDDMSFPTAPQLAARRHLSYLRDSARYLHGMRCQRALIGEPSTTPLGSRDVSPGPDTTYWSSPARVSCLPKLPLRSTPVLGWVSSCFAGHSLNPSQPKASNGCCCRQRHRARAATTSPPAAVGCWAAKSHSREGRALVAPCTHPICSPRVAGVLACFFAVTVCHRLEAENACAVLPPVKECAPLRHAL